MLMQIDGTFIFVVISFLIFLVIIKAILFHPISKVLEERDNYYAKNSKMESESKQKSKALIEEKEQTLQQAKKEAGELIKNTSWEAKKQSEKKIKEANPNLVVSVHMNSFADKSVSGANCFYKIDDEASMNCANLIQKSLFKQCGVRNESAKKGDYFMLNCSYYTSVLIECGFLSNPEDEQKLNSKEYLEQFTNAVADAILLYFGEKII